MPGIYCVGIFIKEQQDKIIHWGKMEQIIIFVI